MYDVVIIGAGVVGGMIARKLASYELQVCIVEKEHDVAMGATKANSAIVHAGFDAKEGSLKALLNVRGSEMMPQITKELGVKYQNNGSLVIGFNDADRAIIETLLERGKRNDVKALRILEKEELKQVEPQLSDDVECALYAPTGAITCPYELTIAAIGNAMDNGAALELDFEVVQIKEQDDAYELKAADGRSVTAKYVINAAGLYSDHIAGMLGDASFHVHPRRGEYILLDKECGSLVSHTIFRTPSKMGKGILISPTVDGNLLLGPTSVDIEDKEDKSTTSGGFDDIIRQAKENVKTLPLGKTITSFCGLRAVGDSGDFIITSPKKGVIMLGGIESPGLSAAPAIAEYVADMLQKQGMVCRPKSDFDPIRKPQHAFRDASIEEKNKIIRQEPAYGKVVCRCETVTEGEILAALRTNPKARDLDGVKRRTRAQMGRCQGGFCGPQIVELIAKELGIAYEDVTKSGKDSVINVGKTKEM